MKYWMIATVLVLGCLVGCKKGNDADVKVTTDNSGDTTKVKVETDKGTASLETDNKGKMTMEDEKGNKVTSETSGKVTAEQLGVSLYPGSDEESGKSKNVNLDTPEGKSYICVLLTSDAPTKVADYYKKELTDPQVLSANDQTFVTGKSKDGKDIMVKLEVKKDSDKTEITISSITKKK